MEHLRQQLDELVDRLDSADALRARLPELVSVYPFNDFEFVISHLLGQQKLTLDEYEELRFAYIDRNLFLYLFEISAPRGFGEVWAHAHLKELVPNLQRPSKKLDASYSGEYDFFLDPAIRIEVKASRAVEFGSDAPLYQKALASDSTQRFDMNFQQIKPACCDVFVWLAAWRDTIFYWVLASKEVAQSKHFSAGQHRGNVGERQLHINERNIADFDQFRVAPPKLEEAIRAAQAREQD